LINSFGYDSVETIPAASSVTIYTGSTTYSGNLTNLSQMADVYIPSPANGEILTWNASGSVWVSQSAASISDTNESTRFGNLVSANCSGTDKVIGIYINGTVICGADSTGTGNASWNESYADGLYAPLGGGNSSWNESYATTLYASIDYGYNETVYLETSYLQFWYNQTSAVNINFLQEILNATGIYSTYNVTYETGSNSSWNESYATTLYALIDYNYNQTLGSIVFLNTASTNLQSNISDVNSSLDTKINELPLGGTINGTTLSIDNITNFNYNYNMSHPSGTNFAVGGNLTLGETITFTLGEIIDNIVNGWITITGGLNVTENIEVVGNVTIEGELNMTSSNITSVDCITFSNGASWCGT